jgi:rubrerythrin
MWEEESKRTGRLPECFGLDWPVSHVEDEFATEILPDVIVHSRPDAVCADVQTIVDYKTLCADSLDEGVRAAVKMYGKARQLPFYGFQVGLHGIRIRKIAYLIEIWNKEQDTILGYHVMVKDLPMSDIAKMLPWVQDRVAMLVAAVEEAVTV